MSVLVGYATRHGSTRGVAERIGAQLRRRGLTVEVLDVRQVGNVARYEAVIVGSAIHGGQWLPDGRKFLEGNAPQLRERALWLFSVSTLGDEEAMFPAGRAHVLRAMRKEPKELAALRASARPARHRNFAGAIGSRDWPLFGRLFFKVMGGRYGDHRNWPAVDAWADGIADQLQASVRRSEAGRS